ncbi:MAG: hypothetical protein AAB973_00225 [Patescibacteria group bacterium]
MPKLAKVFNVVGLVFLALVLVMLLVNLLRRNIYDPSLGINILMLAKDGMGIVAVREGSGLVSVTRLPDNLVIPIDPTGAEYRVEAFYKIGLPVADELFVSRISVGQALGVVLAGVVKSNSEFGLAGLSGSLISLSSQTNFSIFDRYNLAKSIRNLLTKRTNFEISFPAVAVDSVEEADGTEVLKLNSSIFVWSQNQWVADEVLSETAEVTVVNGSGREGKARWAARQMETAGVRVISLMTARKNTKDCLIWGDEKLHPKTFSFLRLSFNCRTGGDDELFDYIDRDVESDLVVVLGEKN